MKEIIFNNAHRKKHFDFFKNMDQPHYGICANVDISTLVAYLKNQKLPFTTSIVYLIAGCANAIPAFRQRIRDEKVIEHDKVHPSFTVKTAVSDVFSFCTVNFSENYNSFVTHVKERMEWMNENPSFEDEIGRDDYLFLSAMPWVSFTGFMHPMHYSPVDSVPRIAWGKYFKENGKIKMPMAVQAHHALVDGSHIGRFYELFEANSKKFTQ